MNTYKEKTLEVKVVNNKDNMTSNTNAMIYTNTSQIGNTSIKLWMQQRDMDRVLWF